MTGQTSSADPLLIITQAIIISRHSTAICMDIVCLVPSGVSSSSVNVSVFVVVTYPTICSRSSVAITYGTWDSSKIFNKSFRCSSDDNSNERMDTCAGNFFNYSTTEYLLLFKVLIDSTISSSNLSSSSADVLSSRSSLFFSCHRSLLIHQVCTFGQTGLPG